jgi:glycosyltransferase involved in cell wall biosynthesis
MQTVLQMHGIEWQRSRWGGVGSAVLRFLEKCSVWQATAVTAVSKQQCIYLKDRYGCDVDYIPTATQIEEGLSPQKIIELGLDGGNYILFASRLVSEKGAHFLIQAYRSLQTGMKLVIAGSSDVDPAYKSKLIALTGGDDRILFTGHVEGREIKELFSNAYLYVQPSTIEGLSIALLEAMSYGRCSLVSDIPENLEALDGSGFSFKSKNVDDLAEKLKWLLDNPQKVHDIGRKAIERVRAEYSWDVVTDKIEALYRKILL